ncbi:MAG TPA: wax ester/triacylglycerol synthase family O-acyltransferase [Solirubrobacteraceae bacterium]|jgi:WS/DGAT/MGAT family acyltransferase|nr:wax ester/triacylglycerol synthase family O-acyltransferase [Solirubrobacteraceae bacterium]
MANPDRLTALDSTFLHLEDNSTAHMHVASVMVFEGTAPTPQELVDHVVSRLHLVPRYRQRLAFVPYDQGRPVWADDPHFNPRYHIRHTALPKPADEQALKQLAGRLFSQRLDRSKPLWEIWLVERMAGERFALIAKTHHALVDGISGVDITTVLFDTAPDPVPSARPPVPWTAKPLPGPAKLLGEALRERMTLPSEMMRGARRLLRAPRRAASQVLDGLTSIGATTIAGVRAPAPDSPFNVDIGPHRRYTFLDTDLDQFKAIKASLGGTLNDVVLAAVSLALGRYLRRKGFDTAGLELKAMVPVSVRADSDRGALGNQVAAMWAPLPVGVESPSECLRQIARAMEDLKRSGQAVGAQVLTNLAGFAPPTILSQAARLQARQRFFNLVVTNVPGPQFPLYVLGRRLRVLYPVVPLAQRQALGIAVMSYDGHLGFGLLGDFDALGDLESIVGDLKWAIASLARAAGVRTPARQTAKRRAKRSAATTAKGKSASGRAAGAPRASAS